MCEHLSWNQRTARFQRVEQSNNTFEGLATRSAARFGSQTLPRGRYPFVTPAKQGEYKRDQNPVFLFR